MCGTFKKCFIKRSLAMILLCARTRILELSFPWRAYLYLYDFNPKRMMINKQINKHTEKKTNERTLKLLNWIIAINFVSWDVASTRARKVNTNCCCCYFCFACCVLKYRIVLSMRLWNQRYSFFLISSYKRCLCID